jgi:isoleucyl-tRNA synthetase
VQAEDWKTLRAVREQVLKVLEESRAQKLIGKGIEAQLTIGAADPVYSVLARHQDELRYLFIVSSVKLEQAASGNGTGMAGIQVSKAAGQKCDRCWNYSTLVGQDAEYPTVCERCSPVLKQIEAAKPAE